MRINIRLTCVCSYTLYLDYLIRKIAYRWSQEVSAMGKLSQEELEMVYKIGFKPTDYLAHK